MTTPNPASPVQEADEQLDRFEEWAEENAVESGAEAANTPSASPVVARLLSELVRFHENDPNELLRSRYLCRGGGLLLVGPTGIGKSSLSMQLMLSWALGRSAFGIQPARPLKSLLI